MTTCGERLREERSRLRLSQEDLAAAAGLARSAQIRYEKGERSPDADYLAAVAAAGVDVQYVVTNVPGSQLPADEADLLRRYRAASAELRNAALAVLGAPPANPHQGVAISGGQQAQVISGQVQQDGLTINLGPKKGGKKR